MRLYFAVAAGGALGAVCRYSFTSVVVPLLQPGFPVGTLAANVAGSFLMGALVEVLALAWSPSEAMRAFLVVGVLGAFTTFSAFSMEAVSLLQQGSVSAAMVYILASVFLSLAAVFAGMRLFRVAFA
ncbi:MAG: fluoride efflux transporter CrcB [Alphaproteobacteria bacterium]